MKTEHIIRVGVVVLGLLLIPFFGNMFVEGWNWSPMDFVIMGTLLFLTGLGFEYARTTIKNPTNRIIVCALVLLACIAVWTELAVDAISQGIALLF